MVIHTLTHTFPAVLFLQPYCPLRGKMQESEPLIMCTKILFLGLSVSISCTDWLVQQAVMRVCVCVCVCVCVGREGHSSGTNGFPPAASEMPGLRLRDWVQITRTHTHTHTHTCNSQEKHSNRNKAHESKQDAAYILPQEITHTHTHGHTHPHTHGHTLTNILLCGSVTVFRLL